MQFRILSDDALAEIHENTIKVMEEVGLFINHEEAYRTLKKAGCEGNDDTKVVKLPRELVEDAISEAPSKFTMYSRDGKHNMELESGGPKHYNQTFGTGTRMTEYVSPGVYNRRDSTLDDVVKITRLVDALDHVDTICPPVEPLDLKGQKNALVKQSEAIICNTVKPSLLTLEGDGIEKGFKMEAALYSGDEEEAREKPMYFVGSCPTSPLQLDRHICDLAMHPEYGFPLGALSMAMCSASAPATIAGLLVIHNAEILTSITLAEIVEKGRKCTYGSSSTTFDYINNVAPVGSPELALISACVAELGKYYHIPTNVAGT